MLRRDPHGCDADGRHALAAEPLPKGQQEQPAKHLAPVPNQQHVIPADAFQRPLHPFGRRAEALA
jgi:hypothetical protein